MRRRGVGSIHSYFLFYYVELCICFFKGCRECKECGRKLLFNPHSYKFPQALDVSIISPSGCFILWLSILYIQFIIVLIIFSVYSNWTKIANKWHILCVFSYSWFRIKGSWSVHSLNGDYLSLVHTGSWGNLLNEIPGS